MFNENIHYIGNLSLKKFSAADPQCFEEEPNQNHSLCFIAVGVVADFIIYISKVSVQWETQAVVIPMH